MNDSYNAVSVKCKIKVERKQNKNEIKKNLNFSQKRIHQGH